ncbi:MAG: PAS domain S-box protein [Candidatus Omnitrophica bacterium]|nr:PAS domain S-box protein [Candidatus Omnitrophota bacterium]
MQNYKLIVELAQDAIFIKDLKSRYVLVNQKALEAFGNLPRRKVVGKSDYALLPPDQAKVNIEDDQKVFKTGKPVEITKKMTAGDKNFYFEAVKTPIKDTKGKVIGLIGIARDITERKNAEEKQMAAMREKQAIMDTMLDSLVVLTLGGEIVSANLAHLKKFGHKSIDEIKGKNITKLSNAFVNPEENVSKAAKLFKGVIQKGYTEHPVEINLRRPDGTQEFIMSVAASVLKDAGGNPKNIVAILRDITAEKQFEEQLISSEKMAAVGQLAAGISHEFNNLMAVIRSSAEFAEKTKRKADIEKSIKQTIQCVNKGTKIAEDLLSFSRRVDRKREKANLKDLIEEILPLIKADLEESDVQVIRKFERIPHLIVDKGQMQQVFLNLIINAKQAMMPKGGTLTVTIKREHKAVSIRFNNTGQLIKKEHINRLFDPFFTTKGSLVGGSIGGVGLGLSVSYGIIQSHGGIIIAESSPGKGTTFTIRLPIMPKKTGG